MRSLGAACGVAALMRLRVDYLPSQNNFSLEIRDLLRFYPSDGNRASAGGSFKNLPCSFFEDQSIQCSWRIVGRSPNTLKRKEGSMAKFALYAHLKAKPGKQAEVEAFLKSALPLAQQETQTVTWYAFA